MKYTIAKRFHHGGLIAYMTRDQGNQHLTFTSRDVKDAHQLNDLKEAEQLASDWAEYWASKGFPGYTATVEEVRT